VQKTHKTLRNVSRRIFHIRLVKTIPDYFLFICLLAIILSYFFTASVALIASIAIFLLAIIVKIISLCLKPTGFQIEEEACRLLDFKFNLKDRLIALHDIRNHTDIEQPLNQSRIKIIEDQVTPLLESCNLETIAPFTLSYLDVIKITTGLVLLCVLFLSPVKQNIISKSDDIIIQKLRAAIEDQNTPDAVKEKLKDVSNALSENIPSDQVMALASEALETIENSEFAGKQDNKTVETTNTNSQNVPPLPTATPTYTPTPTATPTIANDSKKDENKVDNQNTAPGKKNEKPEKQQNSSSEKNDNQNQSSDIKQKESKKDAKSSSGGKESQNKQEEKKGNNSQRNNNKDSNGNQNKPQDNDKSSNSQDKNQQQDTNKQESEQSSSNKEGKKDQDNKVSEGQKGGKKDDQKKPDKKNDDQKSENGDNNGSKKQQTGGKKPQESKSKEPSNMSSKEANSALREAKEALKELKRKGQQQEESKQSSAKSKDFDNKDKKKDGQSNKKKDQESNKSQKPKLNKGNDSDSNASTGQDKSEDDSDKSSDNKEKGNKPNLPSSAKYKDALINIDKGDHDTKHLGKTTGTKEMSKGITAKTAQEEVIVAKGLLDQKEANQRIPLEYEHLLK
jgi:hypothetical protein